MTTTTEAWVSDDDRRISRAELEARAQKGAGALLALGLAEDAPVAVIMRNDLTQLEVMRAAAHAGVVLVALNWHGAAEEVGAICDDSGARTVIIHRDLIGPLRPVLAGRRIIAVTPGPALRAAYGISAQAATDMPEAPEWSDLVDAAAPLRDKAMTRP
ncbi:MAG: AMP-binding protein, partial [Rhodobacterales bacterium]|nr:AMP-binding protein [Rhodobacterales bacterium]